MFIVATLDKLGVASPWRLHVGDLRDDERLATGKKNGERKEVRVGVLHLCCGSFGQSRGQRDWGSRLPLNEDVMLATG